MEKTRSLQMFDYDRMVHVIVGYFRAQKYWAGLDAISFAQEKHGDVMRKSSGLKYFCHPILVAYLAVLLNLEPEIVTIALLHDVPEDAHADFSALPGGKRVQEAVKAVTIMKIKPDESKSDTKVRYYGRMDENIDALIVKMLDRLTNLTSMVGSLAHDSIVKNIIETDQKLLPAVKRARKDKKVEFRKQRDTLFVLQQALRSINEPLAMLFSINEVVRKKHDIARTHARLEGRLEVRLETGNFVYDQSDMALMTAFEANGKYLNGDLKGLRMMLVAAFAIAFGIRDDNAIATILLGDLDGVDYLEFSPRVQRSIRRLKMIPLEGEAPEKTTERFFAELSQNKEALLAKSLYRWVEICYGQVVGEKSISDTEMTNLIQETDLYLIPALEVGKNSFGEYSSIFEFMSILLRLTYESIARYKEIPLEPIKGFYDGKYVE
ncbi:bifunctional (p)ppGpp synthetase/guanosine-3',5'-bis(diphosphate) 3'-pyrophosphohydrolase [Candidatus Saccharibacteria bacterium]|nr:bifunctional (p)ppGpp synthetase/guanosine-3',5'-bis(diphosphate) 3'-pyrophosphohydrolase [Candidatus Saccharibacteria bacterium]